MKHSACRRLWAVLLLTVLLGSLLSAAAWAAPVTVDAGDVQEKTGDDGHIIVTVYDQEPSGAGTGGEITGSNPVAGVGINALRIGSVVELTTTTGGTTVTTGTQVAFGLNLGDSVVALLGLTSDNAIATDGSIHYFAPETVMNALGGAGQATIEDALDAAIGVKNDVTENDGVAEFTSLDYGLYLLAKSKLPAEATTDLPPFLVSVPMYVDDAWKSTVHAYPKVRTATLDLTKSAAVEGVPAGAPNPLIHVSSGDTIHYTLSVTIPENVDGAGASQGFTAFTVTDTNTAGTLKIVTNSVEVELDDDPLILDTDYKVVRQKDEDPSNDQILTVELTEAGRQKLNAKLGTAEVTFTITYSARVNTAVTDFQSALENTAKLTYCRGDAAEAVTGAPEVTLYTYGIELTKTLSGGGKITEGAITFGLYRDETCKIPVSMTKDGQGYWQDAAGGTAGPGTLAVNAQGKLYLYGLKPETYYLKEEATMSGYTPLAQPITIVIEDADKNGEMTATVNGKTAQVTGGVVSLTVENTKNQNGFTLPQTGGAGTLLAAAVGLGLVSAGVVLLTAVRRKKPQR